VFDSDRCDRLARRFLLGGESETARVPLLF
jgi:hypothetical protein